MREGGGPSTAKLDRLVSKATEKFAQGLVALAYSMPRKETRGSLRALAIVDALDGGVSRDVRPLGDTKIDLLALERGLFESDIKDSALLEIGAAMLLLPHRALSGDEYLAQCERRYRRRKIIESITRLAWDYPELSSELLIDPRYFVYDIFQNISLLIPEVSDMSMCDEVGGLIERYREALGELEEDGVIRYGGSSLVTVDRGFIDTVSKRGIFSMDPLIRAQNQLGNLLKLGLKSLTDLFHPLLGSVVEGFVSTKKSEHLNPDRFLLFPTAGGFSSLSDSMKLEDIVGKLSASGRVGNISTERIGGALNEVYLITYDEDGKARKAILKRYPTWVSLKWAPLALWTLGTQNFAVQGRSRMERECATTRLLSKISIKAPQILYTSFRDRLLVKEFIEGENLVLVVRSSFRSGELKDREADLFRRAGGIVAAVHGSGNTLGDCKPDNFIVAPDEGLFVVDLEQGGRGGNPAWDLAEFLLFSGHYAGPLDPLSGVAEVARSFLEGYTAAGGERSHVEEAAELRYTRVFAPFTLPQVIYTIAKVCRAEARRA